MSISFPTSLDSLPNPTSTDLLDNSSPTLDHWTQHANVNDAIEALEAKVGIDGSAVTTSFDYKLGEVTSTDKAVGKTATQTLTNKTLTAPVINIGSDATGDMYYRNGSGTLTRLALGASGTIISSTGTAPEWIANPGASDASTTVKGVSELATYAETIARTTTGGTGAKLVVTPDVLPSVMIYDYQADAVGTDSYAITCTPAPTAYSTGMRFTFKAATANTGAASLNVNALGAKTIKKNYNQDLNTGDILANQIIEVVYDGTNMQLVTPSSNLITRYSTGLATHSGVKNGGTMTIAHGLGVAPKRVKFASRADTRVTSDGVWDGTNNYSVIVDNNGSTGPVSNYCIYLKTNAGSAYITQGTVTVDATNITITWANDGSGASATGYSLWEAFA